MELIIAIIIGLLTNIITYTVSTLWERGKQKAVIHPVNINPWKVTPGKGGIEPKILIATFSGLHCPYDMKDKGLFKKLLKEGDWKSLKVDENTQSIGQTIKAVEAYPSLSKIYLVTTESSKKGPSSMESVLLFEKYVKEKMGRDCEIIADSKFTVTIDEDSQVIKETFDHIKRIFSSLGKEYKPKNSNILVDITGGTKSMTIGALLACLRPSQNVHVIGTKYDENGKFIKGKSFPMIIEFIAEGLR